MQIKDIEQILRVDIQPCQLTFTVNAIVAEFYNLKVGELMLFFFYFKSGRYEKFYNRFDPQALLISLRKFMNLRNYYYDSYH